MPFRLRKKIGKTAREYCVALAGLSKGASFNTGPELILLVYSYTLDRNRP